MKQTAYTDDNFNDLLEKNIFWPSHYNIKVFK